MPGLPASDHVPLAADSVHHGRLNRAVVQDLIVSEGGRCIIPVGAADLQHLWLIERRGGKVTRTRLEPVRFVPLRERP